MKWSIHQEDITIKNIFLLDKKSPKIHETKAERIEGRNRPSIIITK